MPNQNRSPSEGDPNRYLRVIHAVAEHSGTDPTDLPPLYEAVDPDALDALFGPTAADDTREGGEVSFIYAGYRVRVPMGREPDIMVTEETD